jgi:hypothetical protein
VGNINPAGVIAGSYFEPISGNPFGGNYRGFLRDPSGSFTTFDFPAGSFLFNPPSVNPAGVAAGSYTDVSGNSHGFLRIPHGKK